MGTNTLGEIISHLRRKAGLTQEALADGICSPVSVSRIENGNQMPSGKVLEKLLERLGTGTYQLCNVYYENECQASLRRTLAEIEAQVSSGDFAQAREALQQLPAKKMDSANLQRAAMLRAAICMKDGTADENMEAELLDALRLTKPNIDLNDCRGGLFSPAEVNLLVMLTEAKYMAGKNLEAIRLGEEVMFALDRSKSRLSEYKVFQINLAHNLGQYLLKEKRYEEALLYARKAEPKRVFSEDVAYLVTDMLQTAAKEGTARKLRSLPFPVAAKTGTGEAGGENIDAYTIAYTPQHVVAVRLANGDNSPVHATGGGLPANFAKDVLADLYRGGAPRAVVRPQGVVRVSLDKKIYDEDRKLALADPASPAKERWEELFKRETVPAEQSTRFSRPVIQTPRIFVKNGCVSIVLCHAEYYDYVVKRENRGTITTIYSGKYCETISDGTGKCGETYTYTVTPVFGGTAGEPVLLPRVRIEGGDAGDWWDGE